MKRVFCISVFFLIPVLVFAVSEAACIFLLIEPSSRAGGMGKAHVAQADDGFAGYWNPGAMAFNRKSHLSGWRTNWLGGVDGIDDIYINYVGGHSYIESIGGNLGAHFLYMTYGKQDRTDIYGRYLETFHSYEMAMALSYARQMTNNLGLGISLKYIYSKLSPIGTGRIDGGMGAGTAFAFDLGMKYQNILSVSGLDFGINLQNIGQDITFENSGSDPLPMNLRTGLSYRLLENDVGKITINGDIKKLLANKDPVLKRLFTAWTDDTSRQEIDSTIYCWGMEMISDNILNNDMYKAIFSIRSGYFLDRAGSIEGYTGGAGVSFSISGYQISLDFEMRPGGELVEYNRAFSLSLEF